jgi:hypothetical protein
MKGLAYLLVAVVALTGVVVYMAHASGRSDEEADPIFGIKIPSGYRDWKLISVAHSSQGSFRLPRGGLPTTGAWQYSRFCTMTNQPGDSSIWRYIAFRQTLARKTCGGLKPACSCRGSGPLFFEIKNQQSKEAK